MRWWGSTSAIVWAEEQPIAKVEQKGGVRPIAGGEQRILESEQHQVARPDGRRRFAQDKSPPQPGMQAEIHYRPVAGFREEGRIGTESPARAADEEQPFLGYQLSQGRDYSEATAALIDRDLKELLSSRHEVVRKLLASNRERLDELAAALLHEETVGQEQLRSILGSRPVPPGDPAAGGTA